ncbi:glycosyltransferase [Synechococcales cyanobacterium C]|uniref:Glycosyltransferase n=1 Tax=Petrachloros mirabilis ULC683 TaxID=2781853 RepID=A0A8K2AGV6_9CYAN|nr:glycosyltransferase family 2 protein [Petrachloros mirabilis]NCJ05505.1 glycosyltransferase [Petrachloros mirabilis ULC683]
MTQSPAPLVSVIMIFFNGEAFMKEAVESVLAQTYPHWELLFVDDGSTDRSSAIAQDYVRQYPEKMRYLDHEHHQNRGMSAARNLGLAHARGEWVSFLDADDVWLSPKLDQQLALAQQHPAAGVICGPTQYWYSWMAHPENYPQDTLRILTWDAPQLYQPPLLLKRLLKQQAQAPATCSVLIRHEVIDQVGGFVEDFRGMFEDQVFFSKVYLHVPVFVDVNYRDRYRQHSQSSCAQELRAGRYHPFKPSPARKAFLTWLATYLDRQNINDPELWRTVNTSLWPYRHPSLSKPIFEVLHWVDRLHERVLQPLWGVLWPKKSASTYKP